MKFSVLFSYEHKNKTRVSNIHQRVSLDTLTMSIAKAQMSPGTVFPVCTKMFPFGALPKKTSSHLQQTLSLKVPTVTAIKFPYTNTSF